MPDPRVSNLAKLLVEYSVSIRKGDEVLIRAGIDALPLVRELYREIVSRGGYPHLEINDGVLQEAFYRYATDDVLKHLSPIDEYIMEHVNATISIVSNNHTKPLIGIEPGKLRMRQAASAKLTEIFMRRQSTGDLRWTVSIYPTYALAQEAGMGPIEYEDFAYRACMVDKEDPVAEWRKQAENQEAVIKLLSKIDELRVVAGETDLTLKVGGRTWINDDGKHNMPGGEVFSAPVEDAVDGVVKFDYPAVWRGIEVEGVRFKFRRGEVVEVSAEKGEEKLKEIIRTDDGAKRLGEVAFGLNYNITRGTKQILFDEKIGGTMHMALGAAYPETGGKNKSAIHWDFVLDLKKGKVYGDGDLIYENGRFLL
ncbi:MAG: aminopeptidase [Thaumarchaeota archaeon]|nr:aminopeptidase [Nitrososphaerota archaeon]